MCAQPLFVEILFFCMYDVLFFYYFLKYIFLINANSRPCFFILYIVWFLKKKNRRRYLAGSLHDNCAFAISSWTRACFSCISFIFRVACTSIIHCAKIENLQVSKMAGRRSTRRKSPSSSSSRPSAASESKSKRQKTSENDDEENISVNSAGAQKKKTPSKMRAATEGGSDEDEQLKTARRNTDKMLKFARRVSSGGGDDLEDVFGEDDEESGEEVRADDVQLEKDFEIASDGDDSDNSDGEDGELDGGSSTCGVVERIHCTDFMCHRSMSVPLGPNINFITGQNGSGKSAIIAALQICLGMNAKNTHRGNNLSGLIRHGSSGHAVVAVTLRNRGPNAYRHDAYGNSIVIERTLRRGGGSSYKLKNAETGKVVSTFKKELNTIIERFGLWVNNPCCVLDQENSKLFLKGNNGDKYRLFLKATLLEQIMAHYREEARARKACQQNVERQEEKLPYLKREAQAQAIKLGCGALPLHTLEQSHHLVHALSISQAVVVRAPG